MTTHRVIRARKRWLENKNYFRRSAVKTEELCALGLPLTDDELQLVTGGPIVSGKVNSLVETKVTSHIH